MEMMSGDITRYGLHRVAQIPRQWNRKVRILMIRTVHGGTRLNALTAGFLGYNAQSFVSTYTVHTNDSTHTVKYFHAL